MRSEIKIYKLISSADGIFNVVESKEMNLTGTCVNIEQVCCAFVVKWKGTSSQMLDVELNTQRIHVQVHFQVKQNSKIIYRFSCHKNFPVNYAND